MVRLTLQTQLVVRVLLAEPDHERYGLELCELTGLPSGTIYPILARLEQAGWVESCWEEPAVHQRSGRPARRFYRLTEDGADRARTELTALARRRPGLRIPWGQGWDGAAGATP